MKYIIESDDDLKEARRILELGGLGNVNLAKAIARYERKRFPIEDPSPIAAIKFRMDQMGLKQKDMIPFIGSASKVSEVLSGKVTLNLRMIQQISSGLKIPLDTLIDEMPPIQPHPLTRIRHQPDMIKTIRRMKAAGATHKAIADRLGRSIPAIKAICHRHNIRHTPKT